LGCDNGRWPLRRVEDVVDHLSSLADNIASVQARIAAAARRAGRAATAVRLVAVSKTQPAEAVAAAAECGLRAFGENRVEEALPKMQALTQLAALEWHMIGHIQGRKARDVAQAGFRLVHSVDTLKLAQRLSRQVSAGHAVDILLECNVSGEASKTGFAAQTEADWEALRLACVEILTLPGLRVRGLMTMAPLGPSPDAARPFFGRLRELRDRLAGWLGPEHWPELSMGMTDDFEAAIAEGATLVRIGRAIFGERI
jgi:pyridoxal phosphate enzyme (YggS family)